MIKKQKIFRTEEVETLALNDVSLEINAGEFVRWADPFIVINLNSGISDSPVAT